MSSWGPTQVLPAVGPRRVSGAGGRGRRKAWTEEGSRSPAPGLGAMRTAWLPFCPGAEAYLPARVGPRVPWTPQQGPPLGVLALTTGGGVWGRVPERAILASPKGTHPASVRGAVVCGALTSHRACGLVPDHEVLCTPSCSEAGSTPCARLGSPCGPRPPTAALLCPPAARGPVVSSSPALRQGEARSGEAQGSQDLTGPPA